jgi:hypothetical protein
MIFQEKLKYLTISRSNVESFYNFRKTVEHSTIFEKNWEKFDRFRKIEKIRPL